jgi:hypothetical protein
MAGTASTSPATSAARAATAFTQAGRMGSVHDAASAIAAPASQPKAEALTYASATPPTATASNQTIVIIGTPRGGGRRARAT